jgi:Lipocalin-like domain
MNRRNILSLSAIAAFGLSVLPGNALAQQNSLKEQIVGAWTFVSSINTRADGSQYDPWGVDGKGTTMYDANGHFAFMLLRSDLPKVTDRSKATPEQSKAVVDGSIAYYGTYTVDEPSKSVTLHIEGSTFSAFNGADQKRVITSITADEMKTFNAITSGGTRADTIYKRAK